MIVISGVHWEAATVYANPTTCITKHQHIIDGQTTLKHLLLQIFLPAHECTMFDVKMSLPV